MGGVRALAGLALDPAPATLLGLMAAVLVTGACTRTGSPTPPTAIGAHARRSAGSTSCATRAWAPTGALALVFAVALAFALLAPLDDGDFLRAALVGHVLGRWSISPSR